MLIIHGTYQKRKDRGFVADLCLYCDDVQILRAHDLYNVPHLYFIPLGQGTLVESRMVCASCRQTVALSPAVTPSSALIQKPSAPTDAEFETVITRTNPTLASLYSVLAAVRPLTTVDPQLTRALNAIKTLFTDPAEWVLLAQVRQWAILDARQRSELVHELETRAVGDFQELRARWFLRQMATKPPGPGFVFSAVFVCLAFIIPGFFMLLFQSAESILFGVVVGVLSLLTILIWILPALTNWCFRRWFRRRLIARALQYKIDLLNLCAQLKTFENSKQESEFNLREMARRLPMLVDVMNEEGVLPEVPGLENNSPAYSCEDERSV